MARMRCTGMAAAMGGAVVLLLCLAQVVPAAIDEMPKRQSITEAVAVCRYLYKQKLEYENKLAMVDYNIDLTMAQLNTISALIESEAKAPSRDVRRFLRYHDTVVELLTQLREFAPNQYGKALEHAKAALDGVQKGLQEEFEKLKAAEELAEDELTEYQNVLREIQNESDKLQSRIDRYAGEKDTLIDYEKLFADRAKDLGKSLAHYMAVLEARKAEYEALFGQEVPVDTDIKKEAEERLRRKEGRELGIIFVD